MPLESLRQPFDPEQAGHKLREVQAEHEPERETSARAQYEHVKDVFYDEYWRSDYSRGKLHNGSSDDGSYIAYIEEELGVESSLSSDQQKLLEKRASGALKNFSNADLHSLGLQILSFGPERARQIWNASLRERYEFDSHSTLFLDKKSVDRQIGQLATLTLLIIGSYIDIEGTREKMEATKARKKFNPQKPCWVNRGENRVNFDLRTALVESSYDIEAAKTRIEYLKRERDAYSVEKELWRFGVAGETNREAYILQDQLFDILLRLRLEKAGQGGIQEKPITLPTERNF